MPEEAPNDRNASAPAPDNGLLDRFSGAAVVIAAVLAIVAALSPDRPPVAIAAIVLVVGSLALITRRRLRNSRPAPIIGAWVAFLLLAGVAFAIPGSRDAAIYDLLGFSRKEEIRVAAIRVAESSSAYRVAINVANDTSSDQLVTRIRLAASVGPNIDTCEGATPYEFKVADTLHLKQRRARLVPAAAPFSESAAPGYRYHATGVISGICLHQQLSLAFPVGISLPAGQLSELAVELPKHFHIANDKSPASTGSRSQSGVEMVLPTSSTEEVAQPGYFMIELEPRGYSKVVRGCYTSPPTHSTHEPCKQ